MGAFDEMRDKAEKVAADHKTEVRQGLKKAGDLADAKSGGKFSAQVDQAEEFVARKVTGQSERDDGGEAQESR